MADWVKCNSRAVCVKLAVRANVANARSCRLSSGGVINEFPSSFQSKLPQAADRPSGGSGIAIAKSPGSKPNPLAKEQNEPNFPKREWTHIETRLRATGGLRAIGDGAGTGTVSQVRVERGP